MSRIHDLAKTAQALIEAAETYKIDFENAVYGFLPSFARESYLDELDHIEQIYCAAALSSTRSVDTVGGERSEVSPEVEDPRWPIVTTVRRHADGFLMQVVAGESPNRERAIKACASEIVTQVFGESKVVPLLRKAVGG